MSQIGSGGQVEGAAVAGGAGGFPIRLDELPAFHQILRAVARPGESLVGQAGGDQVAGEVVGQPFRQDVVHGRTVLLHGQVFVGVDDVQLVDEIREFFADGGFSGH